MAQSMLHTFHFQLRFTPGVLLADGNWVVDPSDINTIRILSRPAKEHRRTGREPWPTPSPPTLPSESVPRVVLPPSGYNVDYFNGPSNPLSPPPVESESAVFLTYPPDLSELTPPTGPAQVCIQQSSRIEFYVCIVNE